MPAAQSSQSSSPAGTAARLLARCWDGGLPVDPVLLALMAGAKVYARGKVGDPYHGYSGYYFTFNGAPSIEFNVNESVIRQRFVVAHEFGHFALKHEGQPRDVGNFQASVDPVEIAANEFAAALLMPEAEVRRQFYCGEYSSAQSLAQVFGVSSAAISHRLVALGLA